MPMNIQRKTSNIANIINYDASGNIILPAGLTVTGLNTAGYVKTNASGVFSISASITGSDVTGAALTKTDDTNVTITLGGTPATSLLRAASLTLGWTGQLAVSRGGTGAGTLTGVVIGNSTSAMTAISSTTALQVFRVNAAGTGYEFAAIPTGSGTVTTVSVTTANGVSGSVATATTTPAITITLGAITPTSVNSVVLSGSATPTLAVTGTSSISGSNTGDNAVNSLYSGLVSNATHTGDATGATALTVVGLRSVALPALGASAGFLRYTGTGTNTWIFDTATYLTTNQSISVSGDATGSGTTAIALTLATVNSNIGTFNNVTVNAKGLVTAASNVAYITGNQSITLSGDVSGTGTTAITATLATITQSTGANFVKITLDTKGRVTGNTAVASGDITTALGYTPYNATNPSGYTSNTGTVTSVAALTLGTTGTDLSSSVATGTTTPVITLNVPTASASNRGALSSTDWSTFNGKQAALNGTGFVKATGTTISYDNSTYALSSHTHSYFIGTTAVQTSSANQALTGISGITFVAEASDAASITTTISSTSTFFDFNLADDNNNDEWRWRFTPSGGTVYNAMRLVAVSNTASNLIVSGTVTGSQIIRSGGTASQFLKADGSVDSSVYITGNQSISVTGDVTGSGTTAIALTLATVNSNIGTFNNVTVNAKGLVTAASNVSYLTGNQSISVSGDASGSGTTAISLTLATVNSNIGTFNNVTVNAKGLVTAASNVSYLTGNQSISLTGEATGSGATSIAVTLTNSSVIGKVLTGLNITGGTVTATDSILVGFGKLQNQVNGLTGGVTYQGTWNASTNSPALASSTGTKGFYYVVSVAGTTALNGVSTWSLGDWAIYNGTAWEKVDNTDAVVSVNGFTGAVSLSTANVSESGNLYYTDARARAAVSFTAGSGAYNSSTGVFTIPTNTNQLTNGAGFITGNQSISVSGDASGSGTTAITLTLATVNSNIGTFNNVTVNAKGLVTAASNVSYLTGNQSITLSGDVSGSGTTAITTTLATVTQTSGSSFVKINIDGKGRVTGNTAVNSGDITTALGYTPYNSTNPSGYTSNTGTVTSVGGTGTVSGLTLSGTVTTTGSLTLGGTLTLTSGNVTTALGYTPYNSTNPNGYISSYTETDTLTSVTGRGASTPANMTIANGGPVFILKDTDNSGTGVGQVGWISFQDSGGVERAWIGYGSASSNAFSITNGKGDVVLSASTGVAYVGANIIWHAGNLTNLNQLTNGPGYTTNTGTVTSVSGTGTVSGLTLSGTVTTSGSLTLGGTLSLTAANVNAVGAITNNTSGTAGSTAVLTASGALTTQQGSGTVIYSYALTNPQTGLFAATDNANSILTVNRHPGDYYSQLGFSSNGNLYYRNFVNTAINTSQAWQTIWTSSSLTNLNQLTNGPGYITGYSETDTLASVTNRGNTTAQNIVFTNGRKGLIGQYDAAQTQAVFAMGASYILTDGGGSATYGNFYGLAWSYNPDYGGAGNNPQSKAGLNHQLLLMQAGVTTAAIGSGVWTSGNISAANFSGSSSGTNTGDQVNISGNAGTVTDGMYLSASQNVTGVKYFQSDLGATLGSLSSPPLQAYATGGNAAFMSFHRAGNYAVNMGLDSDNVFRIGGWSAAANRLQLDMSGNFTVAGTIAGTNFSGSSSGTNTGDQTSVTGNAGTVGGLSVHSGRNNEANKIVRTDGNGYLQAGYINSSSGNENNNSNADRVWGTNGSDDYLRTYRTSALSVGYAASAGSAGSAALVTIDNAVVYGRSGMQFAQSSGTAGNTASSHQTPTNDWWHVIRMNHANGAGYYADLAVSMTTNLGLSRRVISNGSQLSNWVTILDALNYNSYSPTLTGGGASGSWGISITGSSASCTGNSATASISSQVTVNYNNDSNSTYQMIWGSGNSVYGTAGIYCNPSSDTLYTYAYRGNGNVGGTGEASWHPAGIYSGGTNWLYGAVYLNGNDINGGGQVYIDGWFRNNTTNTGLYNQQTTQHWSSKDNGYWDASSTTTVSSIRFWTGSHIGTLRGYVYANSSNELGFLDSAGTWILRTVGTGNTYLTGTFTASGDVIAYSDRRVKENIETVQDALTIVGKLRGVTYNRSDIDDKSRKVGVIAQEILEVLPEVVNQGDDGMYGVSYGNITAVLIEAIKEQQTQIQDLKKQIEYLAENR